MTDFATFQIRDNGASSGLYVETYLNEPMSPQSIRQIQSLDHVQRIELERELPVYVDLPNVPSYAKLNTMQNQFGMLDDASFAEAVAAIGPDNCWYLDSRDRERAE